MISVSFEISFNFLSEKESILILLSELSTSGKVNAQTLVSAAIKQNRLPEDALQDPGYLSANKDHLQSGDCGSLSS